MSRAVLSSVLLARLAGLAGLTGLTACAPKPVEVEPFTPKAQAIASASSERQPQVMATDDTAEHLAALGAALDSEGAAIVLSVLEAGDAPTAPPTLSVSGTTLVDGEVRTTASTITASGVAPTLPDTGWGGEVARRAQERLLDAGLTVKDGAYASGGADSDLLMEFKRVPGETSDEALQLRLIRRDDGRILAFVTEPLRGSDADAWDRATDAALTGVTQELLGQ